MTIDTQEPALGHSERSIKPYLDKIGEYRPDLLVALKELIADTINITPEYSGVKESVVEFLDLVSVLLYLENHKNNREFARAKAHFCVEYLKEGGVNAEVIEHNIVVDGEDHTLYNVLATVGRSESEVDESTVKGMVLVHHDQVAKKPDEIEATYIHDENNPEQSKLFHPWILDDTIHVASAMMSAIALQQKINDNRDQHNVCVQFVVSDWEELNTRGVRELLPYLEDIGRLLPDLDFMLDGESTSAETAKGIACVFRGKGVRTVKAHISEGVSILDAFADFSRRYRALQMKSSLQAQLDEGDDPDEVANPTAVSATVVEISGDEAYAYLEMRTNSKCSVEQTVRHTGEMFGNEEVADESVLTQVEKPEFGEGVFEIVFDQNTNITTVSINTGLDQHPGKYDPRTRKDGLSAAELLLSSLSEDDKNKLTSVSIGNRANPNTVSGKAELKFSGEIDAQSILTGIKSPLENIIGVTHCVVPINSALEWGVNTTDTPDRECPAPSPESKAMVMAMSEMIATTFHQISNGHTIRVDTRPFNAMVDAGALSIFPKLFSKLFPNGQKIFTWGAGDFNILHGHECITPLVLLLALCQITTFLRLIDTLTEGRISS